MVVWKGEIEQRHGRKAYNLDNTELEVPNFFVITSEEIAELFKTQRPDQILNKSVDLAEIKEAYKEVGISSEVRNASNRARNLVGGQRGNSKVVVRASDKGLSDFELDVGASGLENAIKNVVASYSENNSGLPNLIVQKMIEADYTGAVIKGEQDYVEVVEGLGIALEQGKTSPSRYLIGRETVFKAPEIQLKITQNPMTGGFREKRVKNPEKPFSESEINEFVEKASNSVKFVYKRGSFFVVDVFSDEQRFESVDEIKTSESDVGGVIGQEIAFSDETLPPEEYDKGVVARKGGYISTDAQLARQAEKLAIFSSSREEGEKINSRQEKAGFGENHSSNMTATELKTIKQLEMNYSRQKAYLESYSEVFDFEGEEAIIDARRLSSEGLINALEYLNGDIAVLLEEAHPQVLEKIVEKDFTLGVKESNLESFKSEIRHAEHRFLVDRIREMQ